MRPDLDHWLDQPALRVAHRRESSAPADRLWQAALALRLSDTPLLGGLVRWRIPGTRPEIPFGELFRHAPFTILEDDRTGALVSGLVGRIWTLRRDYPKLSDPEQFRSWRKPGTARVLLANWVEPLGSAGAALVSESRVSVTGIQGRIGLTAVRPLVSAFQHLIASEGIEAAVRLAEGETEL